MLVANSADFVRCVRSGHFYRESVHFLVTNFAGEGYEDEIIEASLAVASDEFHVCRSWLYEIHGWKAWTCFSL